MPDGGVNGRTVTICDVQIHYPSEDYPCLCDRLVAQADGACATCTHPVEKHISRDVPV
jgi:hypothetical protein